MSTPTIPTHQQDPAQSDRCTCGATVSRHHETPPSWTQAVYVIRCDTSRSLLHIDAPSRTADDDPAFDAVAAGYPLADDYGDLATT